MTIHMPQELCLWFVGKRGSGLFITSLTSFAIFVVN